jgi:signal transduction histidine kinase
MVLSEKNGLKQVFINLVRNAAEAMPRGGNIHISTRYVSNRLEGQLTQTMKKDPGQVEITIRDDGPGISDSVKSRLFEPFVSTKKDGHAGLGLSIAYSIVRQVQGNIVCESSDQPGTTFKITLPATT